MRRLAPALLLLLSLGFCACKSQGETLPIYFKLADTRTPEISAEIVRSSEARQLGLMYRRELPKDRGMLFVFPDERPRSFWMKNTYIELDIIYISADRKVVSVSKRARPLTTTQRHSEGPAKYVVEVNGGLADAWGLTAGAELIVEGALPEAQS